MLTPVSISQTAEASRSALDRLVAREVPVSWFGLASQACQSLHCYALLYSAHEGERKLAHAAGSAPLVPGAAAVKLCMPLERYPSEPGNGPRTHRHLGTLGCSEAVCARGDAVFSY